MKRLIYNILIVVIANGCTNAMIKTPQAEKIGLEIKTDNYKNLLSIEKAKNDLLEYNEAHIFDSEQFASTEDKDFANKAFIISKIFIRQNFDFPNSMGFKSMDFTCSNVKDNTITIRSYFSAQNAFGSYTHNKYAIVLKLVGNEWADVSSWQMLSIKFEK